MANDGALERLESLRVTAVSGAVHGSVRLGDLNGQAAIFFTPEANYNSTMGPDPSFTYTLTSTATGETKHVAVTLPLAAVGAQFISNRIAIKSVALCAGSMPATGSKGLKNNHPACVHRRGRRSTTKRIATNNASWRVAT